MEGGQRDRRGAARRKGSSGLSPLQPPPILGLARLGLGVTGRSWCLRGKRIPSPHPAAEGAGTGGRGDGAARLLPLPARPPGELRPRCRARPARGASGRGSSRRVRAPRRDSGSRGAVRASRRAPPQGAPASCPGARGWEGRGVQRLDPLSARCAAGEARSIEPGTAVEPALFQGLRR